MRGLQILLFLSLSLVPELLQAQSFYAVRRERSLIATFGIGPSTYYGELANPKDYIDARTSIAGGLQYFFTNRISARAELTYFQLKSEDAEADDPSRVNRNLSFVSNNFEFNTVGIIQLGPNGERFYQRPRINFYGFIGIGLLYFNPKT